LIVCAAILSILHTKKILAQVDCGIAHVLTIPANPNGCDVQFGLSSQYDTGKESSIALNASNWVVETIGRLFDPELWYRLREILLPGVRPGVSRPTDIGLRSS
jgi:hypothetical protein